MLEIEGNLWDLPADAYVITTNGTVKKNGEAVMGRGVALQAAQRWKSLPRRLGALIKDQGNRVSEIHMHREDESPYYIVFFPVKHNWWEKADKKLIEKSTEQLVKLAAQKGWEVVALVRPGCGNGQLKWEDIRPLLADRLDDR